MPPAAALQPELTQAQMITGALRQRGGVAQQAQRLHPRQQGGVGGGRSRHRGAGLQRGAPPQELFILQGGLQARRCSTGAAGGMSSAIDICSSAQGRKRPLLAWGAVACRACGAQQAQRVHSVRSAHPSARSARPAPAHLPGPGPAAAGATRAAPAPPAPAPQTRPPASGRCTARPALQAGERGGSGRWKGCIGVWGRQWAQERCAAGKKGRQR